MYREYLRVIQRLEVIGKEARYPVNKNIATLSAMSVKAFKDMYRDSLQEPERILRQYADKLIQDGGCNYDAVSGITYTIDRLVSPFKKIITREEAGNCYLVRRAMMGHKEPIERMEDFYSAPVWIKHKQMLFSAKMWTKPPRYIVYRPEVEEEYRFLEPILMREEIRELWEETSNDIKRKGNTELPLGIRNEYDFILHLMLEKDTSVYPAKYSPERAMALGNEIRRVITDTDNAICSIVDANHEALLGITNKLYKYPRETLLEHYNTIVSVGKLLHTYNPYKYAQLADEINNSQKLIHIDFTPVTFDVTQYLLNQKARRE